MRSEFEKQVRRDLRNEKRQKGALFRKILLIFLAFLLWISTGYFCILGVIDAFAPKKVPERDPNEKVQVSLSNENWDEDIFKYDRWLQHDHQIYFGTEHVHESITAESAPKISPYADFFYHYFNSLMHGEYEGFSENFAVSYDKEVPRKFTMQKMYDIYVFEASDGLTVREDGVEAKEFYVKYRILENDGTFRNDLESGAMSHELYRVVSDASGNLKIHQVLPIIAVVDAPIAWLRGTFFTIVLLALIVAPIVGFAVWKKRDSLQTEKGK